MRKVEVFLINHTECIPTLFNHQGTNPSIMSCAHLRLNLLRYKLKVQRNAIAARTCRSPKVSGPQGSHFVIIVWRRLYTYDATTTDQIMMPSSSPSSLLMPPLPFMEMFWSAGSPNCWSHPKVFLHTIVELEEHSIKSKYSSNCRTAWKIVQSFEASINHLQVTVCRRALTYLMRTTMADWFGGSSAAMHMTCCFGRAWSNRFVW